MTSLNEVVVFLFVFSFLALVIYSIFWIAGDAERRGKSSGLVVLFVLLTGPLGILAWLVFRPEPRIY